MAEFIAHIRNIECRYGHPAIIQLEGLSVNEFVVDEYGYCTNVEQDSTIYMTAKQLGLEGLTLNPNELRFKVTVERVE